MCCFSSLSKTDPFLNRWSEGVQAMETAMGTANFIFPCYDLREHGIWSDHIVPIAAQEWAFISGEKKEQLCDPGTSCPVPGHPTLDEAVCDKCIQVLEKQMCLRLAIEASWLSAASLTLCFTNEALVGERKWFLFASVQWLSFVLCRKLLLSLKHLTDIWKSASPFCWKKELVTGISLYILSK